MKVEIETESVQFFSGNICFEFSVLCLCSVGVKIRKLLPFPSSFIHFRVGLTLFTPQDNQKYSKPKNVWFGLALSLELLSIQLSVSFMGEGVGVSKQLEYRGVYCGLLHKGNKSVS
jgi:hypothetical protein